MTITASLYIDDALVADGRDQTGDVGEPTALTGLNITWGRSTTVDQPEPSTCSFQIMDKAGAGSFLGLLYVGAEIAVRAAADVPAPATLPINADTSFEAQTAGAVPAGWSAGNFAAPADLAISVARAATGAQSARMRRPAVGGQPVMDVDVRPAAPSANPAAWDDMPTMRTGEWWGVTAKVCTSPGTEYVQTYLQAWAGPTATTPTHIPANTTVRPTPGVWTDIDVSFKVPANVAGQWPGIKLVTLGIGTWTVAAGTWAEVAGTWEQYGETYVDDLQLLAPSTADIVHRDVLVFAGRVTEVEAGWDDGGGGVVCSAVAADFTADLANRDVGDVPWPAERLDARFAKILAAAGVTIPYTIAPTLAARRMSWMDVDRQQAAPLLQDLATSVDGVLWSAAHLTTGPYLFLADPATLASLYELTLQDGLVVIAPTPAAGARIELDACDVLLDPTVFRQSSDDVVTRAAVSWQEQTVDDNGQPAPTDRTETVIDAPLELKLGTRRVGVSTLLTTAGEAIDVANRILARLHQQSWRVGGVTWSTLSSEMDGDRTGRAMDLLDGTRRLAAPIILTNLPSWTPVGPTLPLFLQGGTYTYDQAAWTLDLTTASAQSQGVSMPWTALDPGWAWNEFDPAVAWSDLIGVTA